MLPPRIVLALQRWGRKAVTPFAISFVLEALTMKALAAQSSSDSPLGADELARRQRDLFKYLLRGPLWDGFTKSVHLFCLLPP